MLAGQFQKTLYYITKKHYTACTAAIDILAVTLLLEHQLNALS
jgi:hypothetical protein